MKSPACSGAAPIAALAARLQRSPAALRAALEADPAALSTILARQGVTVLVVDQLEEMFTLCADAAERELFAGALAQAARTAEEPSRVIFTLRDDFLVRAGTVPALRRRIDAGLHVLTVPAADDLHRILVEPARRAGYDFEDDDLPRAMIAEIEGEPAALALLSFTAARLWDLRDRQFGRLMRAAYRGMGGVGGALAGHAESVIADMTGDERRLTREVFRHLVTADGTRAVLRRHELLELLGPGGEGVLEKLLAARLVTASDDEEGGEHVEVIHEALLEAWPRQKTWRAEDDEGARLRNQLRGAARQWEDKRRPRGLLWRDDTLMEIERWRARSAPALTASEQDFVAASAREAARGRRLTRLLTATTMVALALAAVVLYLLYREAGAGRDRAEASAHDAEQRVAQLYMEQGRQALLGHQPLRALVYLDEALRRGLGSTANRFLIARGSRLLDRQRALLAGHTDSVRWASFSPDGARVATAGAEGVAIVWDVKSGKELLRLLGHTGNLRSVVFSPDGKRLLTAGNDRTIRTWNADTGQVIKVITGHAAEVGQALWIGGGARIVSRSSDGSVGVWDAESGARLFALSAAQAPQPLFSMAISADERLVVAGAADGSVRAWELATGKLVTEAQAKGAVVAVAFSPDATRVVAAGHNADTVLIEAPSGKRLFVLSAPNETIFAVGWAGDGKTLMIAGTDGVARVMDAATGKQIAVCEGHETLITSAAMNRDGTRIVTGGEDTTVRIFSARSGKMLALLVGHRAAVTGVEFSPDERTVVTRSHDQTARLWDARPDDLLAGLGDAPLRLARFVEGGRALTAGADGTLRLWDAATGAELTAAPAGKVLAASADGRRVVTLEEGGVKIVRPGVDAGELLPAGKVAAASFGGDGVWTTGDGGTMAWSLSGGAARVTLEGPAVALAVSPDGATVATAGKDGKISLYSASGGPAQRTFGPRARLAVLAFSRDGRRLLSGGADRTATIWDVARGVAVAQLAAPRGMVTSAAFSSDGSLAVTGGSDGAARVWEAATGKLLYAMDRHEGAVVSVELGDGDRRVLTAADDGARVWDIAPDARPAPDIARDVRCRVPLRLEGDVIVPAELGGAACK